VSCVSWEVSCFAWQRRACRLMFCEPGHGIMHYYFRSQRVVLGMEGSCFMSHKHRGPVLCALSHSWRCRQPTDDMLVVSSVDLCTVNFALIAWNHRFTSMHVVVFTVSGGWYLHAPRASFYCKRLPVTTTACQECLLLLHCRLGGTG
jgi:hypothetical protein